MNSSLCRIRQLAASGAASAMVLGVAVAVGFAVQTVHAPRAVADPAPVGQRSVSAVTADALPTAQINGVVWSQTVVGNTVYVAGSFTQARPAGVAVGGAGTVTRNNLMAYDITTGALITSFAPSLNAQAKVVTASPDGSRIYVGGSFTTADGQARQGIAAYSTSTGQLVASFSPGLDSSVYAIAATNTTVYVGGGFSAANNNARSRLAAFSAANGSLLGWAPTAGNNDVEALVLTPDGSKVIVGGSFTTLNGSSAGYGLGALDASSGALLPWAATAVVHNAGTAAAILSLATDGTAIYGTGYQFGAGGTLEGTFSANPSTGAINWIEDCHGDTYSSFPVNGAVYTVGHAHYCGNVGGFPQTPQPWTFHRALAFSTAATGTLLHNTQSPGSYTDFGGQPSPTLYNWLPDLTAGTFTGQSQAAWSASGNSKYLVLGGEFPSVNGVAQQGLVRFAIPANAPKKQGPMDSGANFKPSMRGISNTSVRVNWRSNWDRDDENLTYRLIRNGDVNHPIYTTTATSQVWNQPMLGYLDTGLTPGASYDYRLNVSDPDGNLVWGDTATIAVPTTSLSPYAQQVLGDGAADYYRLNEASGSIAADSAGTNNLTAQSGTTPGVSGALLNETDKARSFGGFSTGTAGTVTSMQGQNLYSIEAWFKTTSTLGGKVVGFGDSQTGSSTAKDRHVYLDNAGRLFYGVYNDTPHVLSSSTSYNDGQWHQVVATLSPSGMVLYADGKKLGADATVTRGRVYAGYWRVGGDSLSSWPSAPFSNFLSGTIDEVALYQTDLTLAQVQRHFTSSGRTLVLPPNQPPVAAFTSSCTNLACSFDGSTSSDPDGTVASYAWTFGDGATSTAAKPAHTFATAGTFTVKLTVTDNQAATGTVSHPVTPTAPPNQPPVAAFTSSCSSLACTFDGTTSSDPDGTVASYAWTFGDGATSTAAKPPHTFAAAGTYAVSLTVTDNQGATGTTSRNVTVTSASQPPTAAFTQACTYLSCAFDGSTSSAQGGATISSYGWTFGDGTTGTGPAPSHSYVSAGSYTVTLTVTDSNSQSASKSTSITVTALYVSDAFGRTVVSGGWGSADTGGAWSVDDGNAFAVNGSTGRLALAGPGAGATAMLGAVSTADLNVLFDVSVDKIANANGSLVGLIVRHVGSSDYRFKVRFLADGTIHLVTSKVVNSSETTISEVAISGLSFVAGTVLRARLQISGSGTTTLAGKIWTVGAAEPVAAQIIVSDSDPALQSPGSLGFQGYLSGAATNAPVVLSVDNLLATSG
ncbi:MAG: radical SAM protein [Pseudonocardiales bacterium]|nr:MAG: radical SAM protein [Pseudonocardiales bacterium]